MEIKCERWSRMLARQTLNVVEVLGYVPSIMERLFGERSYSLSITKSLFLPKGTHIYIKGRNGTSYCPFTLFFLCPFTRLGDKILFIKALWLCFSKKLYYLFTYCFLLGMVCSDWPSWLTPFSTRALYNAFLLYPLSIFASVWEWRMPSKTLLLIMRVDLESTASRSTVEWQPLFYVWFSVFGPIIR